ncbi:phenoloxidase-activating factor 2-like isoform X2 [Anopheles coustani]|nr:phenoloxidase-activating factor 2-like isoform X2 [Anopheles coustani]XP_058117070.1 phenoloxidase-activating factor 2-like isoform X2 [Anopheles coustani]
MLRLQTAVMLVASLLTISPAAFGDELSLDDLILQTFTTPPPAKGGAPTTTAAPLPPPPPVGVKGGPCGDEQVCIQRYLCSNASSTGEGLIDIRFSDDNPCVDYLLQCCFEGDIIEYPDPTHTTAKPPPVPDQPVTGISPVPPLEPPVRCGKRNVDGIGFRITGGKDSEAEYGEFPWMVAILKTEKVLEQVRENVYQCGGSLIHSQVVLTGAHCVQNKQPAQLKVRAGEWDTQTKNEIYPHQDRSVVEVVVHPDYYKGGLHNDVALLFLDSPLQLNEGIQTVCLPPQDLVFDHATCFASGWGKDVFGKAGTYQVILKKIDLPVVPYDQCQTALRTTRLGPKFNLHKSFLCAGGVPGKDTCKGDGGSPLVCPIPNGKQHHYYQTGLVAWGIGCGENGIPGVYANVAKFRGWIDQHMKQRNFGTDSYTP